MSPAGSFYNSIYSALCGRHPHLNPLHFQWLAVKDLHRDLQQILPPIKGRVLDVGCGRKPYAGWLSSATTHVGIDIQSAEGIDLIVDLNGVWPIQSASFDVILCTQVLEHVRNMDGVMEEMLRVLKPGGILILTVPFCYNEHGTPGDYRRFPVPGIQAILDRHYVVIELKRQGGFGSTAGQLFLNWLEYSCNQRPLTRCLKGLLLPVWVPCCFLVNLGGALLDRIDSTRAFYSNVLAIARKPCG